MQLLIRTSSILLPDPYVVLPDYMFQCAIPCSGVIFEVACQQAGGEVALQHAVDRGQVKRGTTKYGDLYFFPKVVFSNNTTFKAEERSQQQQELTQGEYRDNASAIETFLGGQGMSSLAGSLFGGLGSGSNSGSSSSTGNGMLALTASAHAAVAPVGFVASENQYKEKRDRLAKANVLVTKTMAMLVVEKDRRLNRGEASKITPRVLELGKAVQSHTEECALVTSRLQFAIGFGKTLDGQILTSTSSTAMMDDADRVCQNIIGDVSSIRALVLGKVM